MEKISNDDKKIVIIVCACVALAFGSFLTFIYFAYYYDFSPNADSNVPIPVGFINRYPEKYADKYVHVLGAYVPRNETWYVNFGNRTDEVNISGMINGPSARFGQVPVNLAFTLNGTNTSTLIPWHEYDWYGVFRYTGEVDAGNGARYLRGMLLVVSAIKEDQ